MSPPETLADRNKDLRLGRFSLAAAIAANLALALTFLISSQVYDPRLRPVLATGAFVLFAALALAALLAGAVSWRTRAAQAGMLVVLSTLPCAAVAALWRERFAPPVGVRTVHVEQPAQRQGPQPPTPARTAPLPAAVYFSPGGGCTEAIVREIVAARQTIRVQAYSFTSAPIAAALRDAHRRGVNVGVLLDKSQETGRYSSATFLYNAGIDTRIDDAHAIAHNKVIVIDGATVLTGSFNFSRAAEEKNAENLLVLRDARLADRYADNWREHARHARAYAPPAGGNTRP
jgi:phosphatidylserine/phosphatidylglycerophosphate/cardiolipin synthase-like enzyme